MDYFELKHKRDGESRNFVAQSWNSIPDSQSPIIIDGDDSSTVEITNIDDLIDSGNFIPPYEFYSNKNSLEATNNDEGYVKNNVGTINNTDLGYFWLEDLKNWCSYVVDYAYGFKNSFVLRVWNGRDSWIPIPNLTMYDPTNIIYDTYNIAHIQEKLILNLKQIVQERGSCNGMGIYGEVQNTGNSLQVVHGFILKKNVNYTINDNNFQCIRWSTVPTKYSYYSKDTLTARTVTYNKANNIINGSLPGDGSVFGFYIGNGNLPEATYNSNIEIFDRINRPTLNAWKFAQTNCRSPITQGVPCIWRLPSGDIMLAAQFDYNSDIGNPVYYKNSPMGFKKEKLPDDAVIQETGNWTGILGDDVINASKWVNSYCAKIFTAGTNKTIQTDWLRDYNWTTIDTQYNANTYENLLDSELRFEQHNINKSNDLKCKFTVSRPVVTTTAKEQQDYARKW